MRDELVKISLSKRDVIGSLSTLLASSDVKNLQLPDDDSEEQKKIRETAEKFRSQLGKRYNVTPFLTGSMKTKLNVPGNVDYDFAVRVNSPEKFEKLKKRVEKRFPKSIQIRPDTQVFKGEMDGEEVDFTIFHGPDIVPYKESRKKVHDEMVADPAKRLAIIREKAAVKEVVGKIPFVPERVKRTVLYEYKKGLDKDIGMWRDDYGEKTAELAEAQRKRLMRNNVFGHRTDNLEPIIESQKLLSAAEAGKKGLLKSVETNDPTSRGRSEAKGERELRSEVFITKGLMPPKATYGKYGVLFEKQKTTPSRYMNLVPEEHTVPNVGRSKLTYVVPDDELTDWNKRFPNRRIIQESDVPDEKRLPEKSYQALAERMVRGPLIKQKTEKVQLK
jgi:hypothetical protein